MKIRHDFGVGLAGREVAFKPNGLRDQNRDRRDRANGVTQQDVERIRDGPAGEQVLILRPAIIDLDVTALRVGDAGVSGTTTTAMQQMLCSRVNSIGPL